jgi:hypothetical protein
MAVSDSVDPGTWFAEQIGACEPDLLRSMVKTMAEGAHVGRGRRDVRGRLRAT